MSEGPKPDRPLLRVVRGDASPEELAALVAVLAATAAPVPSAAGQRRARGWSDRAGLLGQAPRPGPGAWRASALPHR